MAGTSKILATKNQEDISLDLRDKNREKVNKIFHLIQEKNREKVKISQRFDLIYFIGKNYFDNEGSWIIQYFNNLFKYLQVFSH